MLASHVYLDVVIFSLIVTSRSFGWKYDTLYIDINLLVGVGKTSLVNLIVKGSSIARPPQTIGCTVDVKVRIAVTHILEDI